jgi:hypothetical protein
MSQCFTSKSNGNLFPHYELSAGFRQAMSFPGANLAPADRLFAYILIVIHQLADGERFLGI